MLTHQIVCQLLPADRVSPGRKKSHPEPGRIPLAAGRRKSSVYRKATERMPLRETKRKRTLFRRVHPQLPRKPRHTAARQGRFHSSDVGHDALLHLRTARRVVVGAGRPAGRGRRRHVAHPLVRNAAQVISRLKKPVLEGGGGTVRFRSGSAQSPVHLSGIPSETFSSLEISFVW